MQPPDGKYNSKGHGGVTASPIEHPRCPKCGSTLLFNGNLAWCPFVGSSEEKACDFGIHRDITRNEATVLWRKSLDVGQRLTDDQIAMFLGWSPTEEVKPESNGSITVEIVEATERRPERVALGFYNVDHHIDIEQAIAMANDILEKTSELTSARQRLAIQRDLDDPCTCAWATDDGDISISIDGTFDAESMCSLGRHLLNLSSSPERPFLADAIHHWIDLSYAQYLTIPRSALQSMPDEWQSEFVALLEELDEAIDWRPKEGRYWVQLKDKKGRYVADPLMDYERGRRRLEHKKG